MFYNILSKILHYLGYCKYTIFFNAESGFRNSEVIFLFGKRSSELGSYWSNVKSLKSKVQ